MFSDRSDKHKHTQTDTHTHVTRAVIVAGRASWTTKFDVFYVERKSQTYGWGKRDANLFSSGIRVFMREAEISV